MRGRSLVGVAAGVALAATALAAPAEAGQQPRAAQQAHHMFSAAAASFIGANTVQQKVDRLSAAAAGLPRLANAYNTPTLWNQGVTGAGATVATLVSYGDADIKAVMDAYDQRNGLPPADISVITPAGAVPGCADSGVDTGTCQGWGGETDLDVAMFHTIAPAAKIVIVATPIAETQGFTGLPEMMAAVDYVARHKLVDVISMSFGTAEDTFPSVDSVKSLDPALERASRAGITLVASSGDYGATNPVLVGDGTFPYRAPSWPGSDPNVTSLGGTVLSTDANGNRTAPDALWPRSGGGVSKTYARPSWQNSVKSSTGSKFRSFPDITMEGIQGTSESAPLFAGVLALAVQANGGHSLGQINPALYGKLGPKAAKSGIVDVTSGDNSYGVVTGYTAAAGFDTVSGWGTLDAAKFVPALVKAVK
ncbi:S8 family serine peptidase [Kutzneria sp. 744]|uniref:S53 family peptidase n=1 Tax=Kutzneria sp. (strain 744) TaxID=345341 RepID=UPI0005BCB7AB|nr:S53 family peptidase [Kutzneria sp. 744]